MAFGQMLILCIFSILSMFSRTVQANVIYGQATWYYDGIGACGGWNVNSDFVVALPPIEYAAGSKCGRRIQVSYQGKSIVAQVVDLCPSCGWTGIDLSVAAFQTLAPLSQGIMQVSWEYV